METRRKNSTIKEKQQQAENPQKNVSAAARCHQRGVCETTSSVSLQTASRREAAFILRVLRVRWRVQRRQFWGKTGGRKNEVDSNRLPLGGHFYLRYAFWKISPEPPIDIRLSSKTGYVSILGDLFFHIVFFSSAVGFHLNFKIPIRSTGLLDTWNYANHSLFFFTEFCRESSGVSRSYEDSFLCFWPCCQNGKAAGEVICQQ